MPLKRNSKQTKQSRPPVVAVLGHVDHGKTTLLDAIRKTKAVIKEHGGITQHIGAYQIEYKGEKITFIDTPGHTAFAKMRSRGASVADLVILVVAANDGVKPQTKESLVHIKQAKTPFLIAINKIDLPQASVDMVKSQLAQNDVLVEGYGGDIVCVEVSAKQKKGIDELLEMILLLAKIHDFQVDKNSPFKGIIIDSKLNAQKGPLATVLVKEGNLKIGDEILAGDIIGKVKLMFDENGNKVIKAKPSKPVEVLGFKQAPPVGAEAIIKEQSVLRTRRKKPILDSSALAAKSEDLNKSKIKIILKTDTLGMLEAIKTNFPEEVEIIFEDVGQINESDVLLAQSTEAQIISFNVKIPYKVSKLAKIEKVTIKTYNIIYKLLEEMEKKVLKILEPTIDEEILGEAKIIAEFNIKKHHIAGCRVIKGKINKINFCHLQRKGKIIADAKIVSFQKEKKEVQEVKTGSEAGIVFRPNLDFKIGDDIISYRKKE